MIRLYLLYKRTVKALIILVGQKKSNKTEVEMDLWKGKVCVVTGSSSGIGAAISKELCQHDLIVVGMARRLDRLEELKKEILSTKSNAQFHSVKCDLTSEENIKEAFDHVVKTFGGVDILINNAGLAKMTAVLDDDNLDDLKTVIDTNLVGLISCTKKAFKSMSERDVPGYIINISSVVGYGIPIMATMEKSPMNVYPCTKFALRALNTVLRHELNYLKKNKIRVSNVSPGLVKSEATEGFPIPEILEAKDLADCVVYLLGTNPRVQVEDVIIRPTGEKF